MNLSKNYYVHFFVLLSVAVSYIAILAFAPVQAETGNTVSKSHNARQSMASCAKQHYTVPLPSKTIKDSETSITSPNPAGSVFADVGLYIEEIPAINELENTFMIEGRLDLVWCDPRLQYKRNESEDFKLFLEEAVQEKLNTIWWPDITFPNEITKRDIADEVLFIYDNGTVEYREKFSVTLEAKYDLSKFPFDKQALLIEMESFAWDEQYLKLHMEKDFIGFSDEFEIPEWHTDNVDSRIEDVMEVGDRSPFSEFLMTIDVTRQFGFYLWKVLLPLAFLVLMCFAIFWIKGGDLAGRLSISFTGVLTVVAYQFIATDSIPKVPYITLMDAYINFSFIVMTITILQSIVVSSYDARGKYKQALRIDKISRWLFPLAYLIGMGFLSLIFGVFR